MKIAYLDCFSGISGDMFLSALVDAGLSPDILIQELRRLGINDEWDIQCTKVMKGVIQATALKVILTSADLEYPENQYRHEEKHPTHSEGVGGHDHITIGEPVPQQEHGHHHRGLKEIRTIIETSGLPDPVQRTSLAIFTRLAEAEAQVHGKPIDEVHFHEVGAVDSILDIVGAAIGLQQLGIERLYCSPLPLGSGQVKTQHGLLPVPAPATLILLGQAKARLVPSPAQVELVTPTGAAILATLATFEQPQMTLSEVGTGAGQRNLPWPNILRLMIGESEESYQHPLTLLETNIDDMNPQIFSHVMDKLFSAGALDVFFTPIQMKKNRPAIKVSVLARRIDEPQMARILLRETSTLGVRTLPVERYEAERRFSTVETAYGPVRIKWKILTGEEAQAAPEYEDCVKLADKSHTPLWEVYKSALAAAEQAVLPGKN